MGRVIFITSFKGGVGKTTVSAGIASALAHDGKRVLICDGDFGMRCMDMVLGLEDEVLFNIHDLLTGKCSARDACIHLSDSGFDFIAAPMSYTRESVDIHAYFRLFAALRQDYDYIIIDSSAEESDYYLAFAACADDALVVSLHRSTSVRAAEKTALRLGEMGFKNLRLIVNCYDNRSAANGSLPSLFDIINRSTIRLLGVIPFDSELFSDQEKGMLTGIRLTHRYKSYEAAFLNIANRIEGYNIPLLRNVYKTKKRNNRTKESGGLS